ncbi:MULTISPECIES: amidohydrolase family protein [unclassified Fusibacter]|uniref:amidohydrolase family protein n=1 Tax=unclassified Fusibacter TaxID=2624464 RepID=UPI00101145DE|nr:MULTISPECIES: amidohydrolase family protein [unclassified Fusibacter]MCK8060391.1 amidohydrolase family protein [Fusibacter sp. A2]NPE20320.1 amidohydrolase family protein [Fusibacter sp. A1]RXV63526.1 hypothetical protein DWB64_00710 [Fusibacter sp. A1]
MIALTNIRLYDYETYIDHGYLIFDHGEIVDVGRMEDFESCKNCIDGEGSFLLPGFINFHTHMYSSFARGFDFKSDAKSFREMLQKVWWRLDRNLTLEDVYWSAVAHGQELLLKGVVGVMDHHASGEILGSTKAVEKAIKDMGLHGSTCFEVSDRFDTGHAIEENRMHLSKYGGFLGLHASMTLGDSTLKKIVESIASAPIHCHIAESLEDQTAFALSPVERLRMNGLLVKDSLLAHCVHITELDAKIIKESGCTVVANVRSNQNNGVGTVDYELLNRYGVPVVVGTDGLGADVAKSWQELYYSEKAKGGPSAQAMTLKKLKDEIRNSYRYYETITGLKLGKFDKGYRFDAVLLDYSASSPVTDENVFSHVFYGIYDDLSIIKMWNGGNLLVDHHKLVREQKIPKTIVGNLWQRIEAEHE